MTFVKNYLFIILSAVLCVFAVSALFHPGFFPIHDNEQIARLYELNNDLVNLHIPPRLSQNLGFGYDYPFFNFYPSFVYYVAEAFKIAGASYIAATKLMIGLGFILSAVFMYLFTKNYFGKLGGLVSAVLYVYAPYHSVDVYVRGALPEFWSFVFVPAIFWGMYRVFKNSTIGNVLLLSVFGFGLIYTHNLVAMMSLPFILIYFVYLLKETKDRKTLTFSLLISGILAVLLSAFFAVPALLENKYTMVSLLTTQLANYNLHFVSLPQFINSAWGYGGSILGPHDGFSLEVGKMHLLLVFVSLGVFAYLLIKKKTHELILIPFVLMFALSLFMQSYYSKPIWDHIQPLSYIQFPWRFMLFSVFSASFIAGYLFSLKFDEKLKTALGVILIGATIIFYFNIFHPSTYLTNVRDSDYVSAPIIRWNTSSMAFEYVPKGIATKQSDVGNTVVDIDKNGVAKGISQPQKGMLVRTILDKPQEKKLQVYSLEPGELILNTYSFPGWEVFVNGKQISYNDKNKLRLISVSLPKGDSLIEAKFANTSTRSLADYLTLFGLLAFFFLLPFSTRKIKL